MFLRGLPGRFFGGANFLSLEIPRIPAESPVNGPELLDEQVLGRKCVALEIRPKASEAPSHLKNDVGHI